MSKNNKNKNKKPDTFKVPETGGNQKILMEELAIQSEYNVDTISGLDLSNKNLNNYKWYELIEFNADYFVNRFNITSDNYKNEKLIYDSIYLGYIYGRSGLYKSGKKIACVSVSNVTYDYFGEIKSADIISGSYLLNRTLENYSRESIDKGMIKTITGENLKNLCIYEWNLKGFGSLKKFLKFSKNWEYWLTIINNQKYILKNAVIMKINNKDSLKSEMEIFYNPEIAVSCEVGDLVGGVLSNKFSLLELNPNQSNQLKESYLLWKNEMFELFGREFLQDPKAERKISAEVEQGNNNVATIEYGYYIQVKNYSERLKEFLNDNSIRCVNNLVDKTHINKEEPLINNLDNDNLEEENNVVLEPDKIELEGDNENV